MNKEKLGNEIGGCAINTFVALIGSSIMSNGTAVNNLAVTIVGVIIFMIPIIIFFGLSFRKNVLNDKPLSITSMATFMIVVSALLGNRAIDLLFENFFTATSILMHISILLAFALLIKPMMFSIEEDDNTNSRDIFNF